MFRLFHSAWVKIPNTFAFFSFFLIQLLWSPSFKSLLYVSCAFILQEHLPTVNKGEIIEWKMIFRYDVQRSKIFCYDILKISTCTKFM